MATFYTYAEVLTPGHVVWHAHAAGITERPPGTVLQDILDRNGGVYHHALPANERFRERARRLAGLPGNEEFDRLSRLDEVPISLEHLRGIDTRTRICCGYGITVGNAAESECMGPRPDGPADPGTTVPVTPDPERPWRVAPESPRSVRDE